MIDVSEGPTVSLDVMGQEIIVPVNERIGADIRRAMRDAGGNYEDAQYIHREHIEFLEADNEIVLVNHGTNSTKLNGDRLATGEARSVTDGDVIELSEVVDLTVRLD
jgi:hypothetical protein